MPAAAASFLRNHRKKERHYAPSLCNYRLLALRTPSFLNAEAAGDVRGQSEVFLLPLVEMGTAPPRVPGYDMLRPNNPTFSPACILG